MQLKELETQLAAARKAGAVDTTVIYAVAKTWQYMKNVTLVEFQKRENWPKQEWPVVITVK